MKKQYVTLDIDVFERYFNVFHLEALSEDKCLYILSAQVGNTVYTALVSSIYAGVLIREQQELQELLGEINSRRKHLGQEVI